MAQTLRFGAALIALVVCGVMLSGQNRAAAARTKSQSSTSPKSSDDEKQAQFHYKVAVTALQHNDLEIAERELQKAVELAPNNALVHYNLAVVKSKTGRPIEAISELKRAIQLGLPSEQAKAADDLLVRLTYDSEKGVDSLSWLEGTWKANLPTHIGLNGGRFRGRSTGCDYLTNSVFTFNIVHDVNHPDKLIGEFRYDAQATEMQLSGAANSYRQDAEDYCTDHYGPPGQVGGHAAYKITEIKKMDRSIAQDLSMIFVPDSILITGFQDSCQGYCKGFSTRGWDSGPLPMDFRFTVLRLDDQHIKLSAYLAYPDIFAKQ